MPKSLNRYLLCALVYFSLLHEGSCADAKLANKCGPICIYETARFFGKDVDWDAVMVPFAEKIEMAGISLLDIRESLAARGLSTRYKRMSAKEFADSAESYAIFHIKNEDVGHFVIVRNLGSSGIQIINYPNLSFVSYSDVNDDAICDVLLVSDRDPNGFLRACKWIVGALGLVVLLKFFPKYKNVFSFQK